jgi:hypothetical protein
MQDASWFDSRNDKFKWTSDALIAFSLLLSVYTYYHKQLALWLLADNAATFTLSYLASSMHVLEHTDDSP